MKTTFRIDGLGASGKTDANGNLDLQIYQNSMQRHFVVGRLVLWADGYTPAAPWSGANTWGTIQSGVGHGNFKDFFPYTAGASCLPNIADYSGINGLRFDKSEVVWLHLVGGPVSTNITARIYGFAEPNASDYEV